jgi:hypothetical protein
MNLYLIKRGPRPDIHKMPYHQVIICASKKVAKWEAGYSSDQAWVWTREGHIDNGFGWLLERWNGLDIDYGVVHNFELPDGTHAAYWRNNERWPEGIQGQLEEAIWWSTKPIPAWLIERGVKLPDDEHSLLAIQHAETLSR